MEARDVRIASLTSGMRLWADRAEAAEQRVRESERQLRELLASHRMFGRRGTVTRRRLASAWRIFSRTGCLGGEPGGTP